MDGTADVMDALVEEASLSLGDEVAEGQPDTPAGEAPSAAEPQTAPPPSPADKPAWSYDDFIARYESDADFRKTVDEKHIKVRANALFQRERDREAKSARKAQLAGAVEDPVQALELAKSELEQLQAEEGRQSRTAAAVQEELERLASDEDDGPFYAELYKREGGDKLNAILGEDPQAGVRWIRREVRRLAVAAESKRVTPVLAEAMAAHKANESLAALPVPLSGDVGGGGSSDKEFLEAFATAKSDDFARAIKLLGL